jgi:hypothetical protein
MSRDGLAQRLGVRIGVEPQTIRGGGDRSRNARRGG